MATALALRPSCLHSSASRLLVPRGGIVFRDVDVGQVHVQVRVHNLGTWFSSPTSLTLQAAPLGAHLAWKTLDAMLVPAIPPRHSVVVDTLARRPRLQPLGDFDDVPPKRLIAAMDFEDGEPQSTSGADVRQRRAKGLATAGGRRVAVLPPDPLELLGRRNPHWAGNLNGFIGGEQVERHSARALRVYPGRTNLAAFFVGQGPDAYRFELETPGPEWTARLFDRTCCSSLLVRRDRDTTVPLSKWLPTRSRHLYLLATCPPEHSERGEVLVHVCQRSSGKTAVVEFSLDPEAEGPGCYMV